MNHEALSRQDGKIHWGPCLAMTAVSLISYVDRSILSVLSPTILKDLGLTVTQYGFAVSTFSVMYALGNPIWGYAIDRVGLSVCILCAVALWSVASGLHALVFGFAGLCLVRGLLGASEGATFPAGLKIVTETLPKEKRTFGVGLSYSGGCLGAALTALIAIPVAESYGWRATFFLSGGLGILWILVWKFAGLSSISSTYRRANTGSRDVFRVIKNWKSKGSLGFLGTVVAYSFGALPLGFGLYAAPIYLSRVLHQSQEMLRFLLWLPPLGWEAGYLIVGAIVDYRMSRTSKHPTGLFVVMAVLGTSVLLIPAVASLWLVVLLFVVSMFSAGGFVVLSLAHGVTIQGESSSGFLAGTCAAAWSVVVMIVMPIIGALFDKGDYAASCLLVGIFPIAGTIIWSGLYRAMRRISEKESSNRQVAINRIATVRELE